MQNIKVLFIAGFGPIVRNSSVSRQLYKQILGVSFKEEDGDYLHTEALEGAKTFALWPLSQASQSCFGRDSWPEEVPAPEYAGSGNARRSKRVVPYQNMWSFTSGLSVYSLE